MTDDSNSVAISAFQSSSLPSPHHHHIRKHLFLTHSPLKSTSTPSPMFHYPLFSVSFRQPIVAITRRMSDIKKYHYPDGLDKDGQRLFRARRKREIRKQRERERADTSPGFGFGNPSRPILGLYPEDNPLRLARERSAYFHRFYDTREQYFLERRASHMLCGGPADGLLELLRARYMERHVVRLEHQEEVTKKQGIEDDVKATEFKLTEDIPHLYTKLIKEIDLCDEIYYAESPPDKPRVTDQEYDELIMHLIELERQYPQLLDILPENGLTSPSQRVGHNAAARSSKLGLDQETRDRQPKYSVEDGHDMSQMDAMMSFNKTIPVSMARATQYKHHVPMLSLDNARSHDDLHAFFRRASIAAANEISAELKLDGVALSLEYRNGVLYRAATRGSGRIGDDITKNVQAALVHDHRGVVNVINNNKEDGNESGNVPDWMIVRGEVYISSKDFEIINKELPRKLSNARNAAAGALQHKDPTEVAKRRVRFVAYDCFCASLADIEVMEQHEHEQHLDQNTETESSSSSSPSPPSPPSSSIISNDDNNNLTKLPHQQATFRNTFATQSETLQMLKQWGFGVMPRSAVCTDTVQAEAFARDVEEHRADLPMEIDGIVFKYNDAQLRLAAGATARAPRGAIAYKFMAQARMTKIEDVVFQVSRKGIITPVAVLTPVRVGGALLSRATLHNFDEIERLGVCIGDNVLVERGGDVIPKIVSVVGKKKSDDQNNDNNNTIIQPPKLCPCCGSTIEEDETLRGRGGTRQFVCTAREACSAQAHGKILHFVNKSAMNIRGFGSKTVHKLVNAGLIVVVADIFRLTKDDILSLPGFAEHSTMNLINEIEEARTSRSLQRLIIGLGLPGIGRTGAKDLAERLGDIETLIKLSDKNETSESETMAFFQSVPNIAERTASILSKFLQNEQNFIDLKAIAKFVRPVSVLDDGYTDSENVSSSSGGSSDPVKGKSFVFTGKFVTLNRPEVMKWIRGRGGRIMSDVSRRTDFVVYGTLSPGQKLFKAQRLKVMTVNETDFLTLFEATDDKKGLLKKDNE